MCIMSRLTENTQYAPMGPLKVGTHFNVTTYRNTVHTVTLPRTVTPYRDSVYGTRDHVT
jgi:hypothetical protein